MSHTLTSVFNNPLFFLHWLHLQSNCKNFNETLRLVLSIHLPTPPHASFTYLRCIFHTLQVNLDPAMTLSIRTYTTMPVCMTCVQRYRMMGLFAAASLAMTMLVGLPVECLAYGETWSPNVVSLCYCCLLCGLNVTQTIKHLGECIISHYQFWGGISSRTESSNVWPTVVYCFLLPW